MNQRRSDSALRRFPARTKFDGRQKSKSTEKIVFFFFLFLLRGEFRRHNWGFPLCKLFWLVFFLAIIAFGTSSVDACSPCGDDLLYDVSPQSASFCFPSTPMDFDSQEGDACKEPCFGARASEMSPQRKPGNVAAFKLADGGVVSCRLVDSEAGFEAGAHSNVDDVGSCVASLVPDVWMKESSEMDVELDEDANTNDLSLNNGSSSGNVEITPPFLNWGEKSLYTPSIAILTVKNTNVSGVLDVYEPYSSDPQYYAYHFQKLALAPGESASIEFVFLPNRLGFSSVHLILQTSFGGFIIRARGVAVESPYKIEPLVGTMSTNVPPCKMLSRNFSLYNPFEEVLHLKDVNSWVFLPGHKDQAVHIFCRMDELPHQSSNESDYFLTEDEWFRIDSRKLGVRWLDVRPRNNWQVSPHMTQTILEMRFLPLKSEKIIGAVCLNLQCLAHDRLDTPVLPLELDVHHKTNYNYVNNSVSLDIERLESCKVREAVLIISLRNDGSDLLSLTKISEVTDSPKLFKVRFKEGLLLFPRTSTKIALVKYNGHIISQNIVPDLPREGMKCQLLIGTNHSVSPMFKISCLDLVYAYSNIEHGSAILASDGFYITGLSQDVGEKYANGRTSLKTLADSLFPMKQFLEEFEAEEEILRNWKSQGTVANASVLEGNELSFPVVPVGSHLSKWIPVHNPSWRPVLMQVLLNSWVSVNECKPSDELSELSFLSRFSEIGFPKTRIGFSIPDSAITEALVHPSESALFGPIFFHPSNRCMWRASALIRNNLSGVEWLPIRAFGGSHLLILLEGSEPVWKLEFDFHFLVSMSSELSSSRIKNNSMCSHRLSKEIYAKNIGELPLVVKKLKVSGTDCRLDGFLVHECHGFTLEPGESKRMLLSYEPYFSTEIVHRDLELVLAAGIFAIPMKASLPVNMLNLCRKNFFYRVRREVWLLVFAAVSMFILLLIDISPPSFSMDIEENNIQVEKKINPRSKTKKTFGLSDRAKASRSTKEDENPHAKFFNEYQINENLVRDNTNKMQDKHDFDLPMEIAASASKLTKQTDIFDKYSMLGAPQSDSLTIRIKEKGRRRKRRSNGSAGFLVKQEVSSSQSGNSTPSSPLSSNASTPKQAWPLSPEPGDTPFAGGSSSEPEHQRILSQRQYPAPKSTGKQTPASPVAPYARAPGPNNSQKKAMKVAKNDGVGEQYSYDIWGNHFYNNFFGRPKEMSRKMHDTSEGDHQSFFAIDPQSLMMMPSACSVSPGQQLPSDNVTNFDQMN
ncbi:uncharacterized protein LOC121975188 isoform X1 [Zingiber officinale]|uniref:uncharacterized protein LOC121975188 isoform X1 n=1 Tax=Zingiber officinale TaxID=94328 RepID=UPI001C4BAE8B|nr:uncharacterized protein LOC121975188 isoform X1 [Zingiber officinale]